MDADAMTEALPPACLACGATVRADVDWCTQCYAPLRQRRDAVDEASAHVRQQQPDASAPLGGPAEPDASGSAELAGAASRADAERQAEQMLARLAAQRDESTGLTSRLPSTPGGRAALVAAVIVLGTALMVGLMFVLGAVL